MANVRTCLEEVMKLDGVTGAVLVDLKSGKMLGIAGDTPSLDIEAAANADLVKAKFKVLSSLDAKETVEDAFFHPFMETVVDEKGNKTVRVIDIHRDRVKDYLEGRTACVMRNDGTPLGLARQDEFMKMLEYAVESEQKIKNRTALAFEV